MTRQLLPEDAGSILADFERRLHILESTSRVGLSSIGWARQTDSGTPVSTFTAWHDGNNTNTWINSAGVTGVHYPRVSVPIGPGGQCLVILSANPNSIGPLAPNGFKTQIVLLGIGIDGADPSAGLRYRTFANSNAWNTESQLTFAESISGLSVGSHEFKVWASFNNNGGAPVFIPQLNSTLIVAIPL